MSSLLESRTLHFDLSAFPQDKEYTLLAGKGRKYVLNRYADFPAKLDEHRSKNKALGLISEAAIGRISHFIEEAQLDGVRASMRRVVFPTLDKHPLPEIAMAFFHVPARAVRKTHHRLRSLGRILPHPLALATYGVEPHLLAAAANQAELYDQLADIKPPGVTAQAIVLNHPELGTVDPTVVQSIVTQYLQYGQSFSELVQYIQANPPGTPNCWYNKSWSLWAQNDDGSGPLVPTPPSTDLPFKNGGQPDWPVNPDTGEAGIPTYGLTDSYDQSQAGGSGVIGAANPCVSSVLKATKNDPEFNGLLWNRQSGITQVSQTGVPPTSQAQPKAAAAKTTAVGNGAAGFGIKNLTSSYGLYLYGDQLSFDYNAATLTFPVKNWPSRYLGAYVQFQQQDGEIIKRADIKATNPQDPSKPYTWQDPIPEILRPIVEPSDSKNYLTWLSSGASVFGAPVPPLTQTSDLQFLWPDNASKAVVLFGGLGVADGFSDWDSAVDPVGVFGTGLICYGVGTAVLLFDVYVVNPFIEALEGDNAVAFYAVAGVIGVSALVVGGFEHDTSWGKMILSTLAGIAASVIFGQIATRLIKAGAVAYAKIIAEAAGELTAEITVEEALEEVPVAGWALRVVSIAADIAGLTATTVECLLSPSTYQIEVLRTMDLTVTVKPDPTHGKKGFSPVWPLVSDHYVIQVKYPSANNQDGGTTYTKSGPMPGEHDDPITVTFTGIPAGGKISIAGNIYSETDWLCGNWDSGWINAIPDQSDQLTAEGAIVELLVPLTATTTYSQKQTVAYSQAEQHYWEVTRFSIGAALVPDLDKGGTPDAAIDAAFAENDNTLSSSSTITVAVSGSSWTISDPTTGDNFQIDLRQISSVQVFTMPASQFTSALDKGGATPQSVSDYFDTEQYSLPAGTEITVVTQGSSWTIGLPGNPPLYALKLDGDNIDVFDTQYELMVQNTAKIGPPLPAVYPLPAGPTGNQLGALQNIIINDNEFELGYAWMASGQNMPLDDGTSPTNVPMYTMQSISTLGQPQEQIIEPTRGFSLPSFIAYNQFGLTPVFPLDAAYAGELNNGGPVPADIVKEFADFGIVLPSDAEITVVTPSQEWTIGEPSEDPLYDLRMMKLTQDEKTVTQIGVFSWPIPKMDNFYLDPRAHSADNPVYYLRGINLDVPGSSTFDYSKDKAWGRISDPGTIQGLSVHPQGYIVAVDFENHKMFSLKLPADASDSDQAPFASPLSGEGIMEGLMQNPTALTITADGRVLILEQGNKRVQSFDVKGNAVPSFALQSAPPFPLSKTFIPDLDNRNVTTDLIKVFQQNVIPALAPKFIVESYEPSVNYKQIIADLDAGIVDDQLVAEFVNLGYAAPDTVSGDYTVAQNVTSISWIVSNTKNGAVYDIRVLNDSYGIPALYVFTCFNLSITLVSHGTAWTINDSTSSMTFSVSTPNTGDNLSVQQVVSYMPLRDEGLTGITYLDIATETKGYIYILSVLQVTSTPVFRLDIYNPDGTQLLAQVQEGVNAGRITVDQYRSLFSLNFNVVLGPGGRTEPGVSEWAPSTPDPAN